MFGAQTTDSVCCPSRAYLETRDALNAPGLWIRLQWLLGRNVSRCPGCPAVLVVPGTAQRGTSPTLLLQSALPQDAFRLLGSAKRAGQAMSNKAQRLQKEDFSCSVPIALSHRR